MEKLDIELEPVKYEPAPVTDTESEKVAAAWMAEAETRLRAIEDRRTALTKPMNDAIKEWNRAAKAAAKPFEDVKEKVASMLAAYRSSQEIRSAIHLRDRAERLMRRAEKEGDVVAMTAHGETLNELLAAVPKSVPASDTMVVRYRSTTTLDIDESMLPDEFFVRTPDEKAIKAALEEGRVIPGVTFTTTLKPYVVDVGEGE